MPDPTQLQRPGRVSWAVGAPWLGGGKGWGAESCLSAGVGLGVRVGPICPPLLPRSCVEQGGSPRQGHDRLSLQ